MDIPEKPLLDRLMWHYGTSSSLLTLHINAGDNPFFRAGDLMRSKLAPGDEQCMVVRIEEETLQLLPLNKLGRALYGVQAAGWRAKQILRKLLPPCMK